MQLNRLKRRHRGHRRHRGQGHRSIKQRSTPLAKRSRGSSSLSSELHGKIEADNQKMAGIDSSIQKDLGSIKDLADQYNGSNAFFYALDSSTTFIGDMFGQQEAGHHLMRSFEGKDSWRNFKYY